MTRKDLKVSPDAHAAIIELATKAQLSVPAYIDRLVNDSRETPTNSAVSAVPKPTYKPICQWHLADWKVRQRDADGKVIEWDSDFSCPIRLAEPTTTTEQLSRYHCKICLRYVKKEQKIAKPYQPARSAQPQAAHNYREPSTNYRSGFVTLSSHDPALTFDQKAYYGGR